MLIQNGSSKVITFGDQILTQQKPASLRRRKKVTVRGKPQKDQTDVFQMTSGTLSLRQQRSWKIDLKLLLRRMNAINIDFSQLFVKADGICGPDFVALPQIEGAH